MADREELEALRRLAELEDRRNGLQPFNPVQKPGGVLVTAAQNLHRGVPQGREQTFLRGILGMEPFSEQETAFRKMQRERGWGTGWPKFAEQAGGAVTDVTKSPLAGAATNMLVNALPIAVTSGSVVDAPPSTPNFLSRWLMKSAVKPSQTDRLSGAADRAVNDMLLENISPSVGGMNKAAKIARAMDESVAERIANSPASIPLSRVEQGVATQPQGSLLQHVLAGNKDPMTRAVTQVNPSADINAVRNTLSEFRASPLIKEQAAIQAELGPVGEATIPVQLAHALKRGTYKALGEKAYGEVGSSSTEAQKALASALRKSTIESVPGVASDLAREARMMNIRDVALNRASAEANKNLVGLAGLRMDDALSAATFWADRSAWLKGLAARLLHQGSQPNVVTPAVISAGEAIDTMRGRQ